MYHIIYMYMHYFRLSTIHNKKYTTNIIYFDIIIIKIITKNNKKMNEK